MTANLKQFFLFTQHSLTLWLIGVFSLMFSTASLSIAAKNSHENSFQLTKIAQLNHQDISVESWQQLIANPANKQQYFAINEAGGVYLVDGSTIVPQALLALSGKNNEQNIKLTAFTLHPNFSLRDQIGYSTFYTAHIEVTDTNSSTKRLQERDIDLVLTFDAVVTEWKFNLVDHQKVDLTTKREVLRIAVPDNKTVIKQLAFNPFIKSWNDNFGLLYIALNGQKKWLQPLYSGAILRIHPAKFGLRSYTVPLSNPFLKNNLVNDAIYLFGSQSINKFIWPNKSSEQMLLQHQYNQKSLLSYSKGGDNWRDNLPKKILYQGDILADDIFIYQGRKSPQLRNKLLLLKHQDKKWSINALPLKTSVNQNNDNNLPQLVWQFPVEQLPSSQSMNIISNRLGEMLLFDKTDGTLYQLSQQNVDFITPAAIEHEQGDSKIKFVILLLFAVTVFGYYFVKRNKFSAKTLVRQQFAHLEISESQLQIGLYHRHEKSTETVMDIVDIQSSEIFLNDHSVNIINTIAGHGFSNEKEQDLRAIFTKEHIDKMVDGKVRVISLQLVDKHKKHFVVCFYLRKGSDRITKKGYFTAVDELVDWCWLIAEKINSDQTGSRVIKPANEAVQQQEAKRVAEAKIPLHNQAAAIRPATHKNMKAEPNEAMAAVKTISQPVNVLNSDAHKASAIDTELVNALEKLVNLKQQGYLTTAEFAKAKEKLLQNLFDK